MVEKCPYCREAVEEDDRMICPSCKTPHHPDCWHENEGCTIFGCENTPVEEPKVAVTELDVTPMAANSPTAKYFLARGGEKSGPFSFEEVLERHRRGFSADSDLCWREGTREWVPLSRVLAAPIDSEPAKVPEVLEEEADPMAGVPRFGRRVYFSWLFGMLIVSKLFMISESTVLVGALAVLVGWSIIAYKRLRDLGYAGWYLVLFFVPIVNILIGFHLLFSPRGYAITKKRDWVQITGIILCLGFFLLIVLGIALPNLSR
ncbi:hypothetical protein DB345_03475 [Spartobacteria bacterium LR76]|nr:hypothetical protein DB345_03475 [Spartobacteria bacterium LR76]